MQVQHKFQHSAIEQPFTLACAGVIAPALKLHVQRVMALP
jgi:hypothetical protein